MWGPALLVNNHHPVLVHFWANACDIGTTLIQRWVGVWRLQGYGCIHHIHTANYSVCSTYVCCWPFQLEKPVQFACYITLDPIKSCVNTRWWHLPMQGLAASDVADWTASLCYRWRIGKPHNGFFQISVFFFHLKLEIAWAIAASNRCGIGKEFRIERVNCDVGWAQFKIKPATIRNQNWSNLSNLDNSKNTSTSEFWILFDFEKTAIQM